MNIDEIRAQSLAAAQQAVVAETQHNELLEVVQLLDALIDYCGCDPDEVEYERAVIKQLCEKYGWIPYV